MITRGSEREISELSAPFKETSFFASRNETNEMLTKRSVSSITFSIFYVSRDVKANCRLKCREYFVELGTTVPGRGTPSY